MMINGNFAVVAIATLSTLSSSLNTSNRYAYLLKSNPSPVCGTSKQ